MKTKVNRKQLVKALDFAKSIAERRSTMIILGDVLLSCSNKELTISATNLSISVLSKILAEIETEGQLCISAKNLYEIIHKGEEIMNFFSMTSDVVGEILVEGLS